MKWYHCFFGASEASFKVTKLFASEFDYERETGQRRGIYPVSWPTLDGSPPFEYFGQGMPPDFLCPPLTTGLLMSQKAKTAFEANQIKGFRYVPASIRTREGGLLTYWFAVTPFEYESLCFRHCAPAFGKWYEYSGPIVTGIDPEVSDVWIGPHSKSIQLEVFSEAIVKTIRSSRLVSCKVVPFEAYTANGEIGQFDLCREGSASR